MKSLIGSVLYAIKRVLKCAQLRIYQSSVLCAVVHFVSFHVLKMQISCHKSGHIYIYLYICVYILYMYLDTSSIYASYVSLLNVAASGDALKTLHLLPRERESELDGGKERARVCDSFATWWILVALKAISTPISHRFKVVLVSIRMAFKQSFLKQTHKHTHTNTRTLTHTWLSALECLCLSIKIVNGETRTRTRTRTRMRTHQRSA